MQSLAWLKQFLGVLDLLKRDDLFVVEGSDNEEEETPDFPADEEKTSFVLRFVPDDQNALDGLYSAIAECQALNPDSEEFSEEDIGDVPEADEDEEENDDGENADEGAGGQFICQVGSIHLVGTCTNFRPVIFLVDLAGLFYVLFFLIGDPFPYFSQRKWADRPGKFY